MNDINFFEPYIEKREFKIDKNITLFLLVIIYILFIIVYSITNQFKISKLSKNISKVKKQVEDEEIVEKVNTLIKQEKEVNSLNEKMERLNAVDEYIVDIDKIDETIIQIITSRTPNGIFLNSVDMDIEHISIIGTSKDKNSIAEFIHSLENTDGFLDAFISDIYLESDYYVFSIDIQLREKDEDDYEHEEEEFEEEVQPEE